MLTCFYFLKGCILVRKATIILLLLTICITNLFIFNTISNYQVSDLLYGNTTKVIIDYQKAQNDFDNEELINALINFSKENQVNITQYNFVSESSLNIYSTIPSIKSYVHLKSGNFPKDHTYISNKVDNQSEGVFDIFSTTWNVRIYNFNQIKNVGLKNELFLHKFSDNNLKLFKDTFIKYGDLKFENSKIELIKLINYPLLLLFIFSIFLYFLVFLAFTVQKRQEVKLYTLFGYSHAKIIWMMIKKIFKPSVYLYLLITISYVLALSILEKSYILKQYYMLFISLNILFFISILLVSVICIKWIIQINLNIQKSNAKYLFEQLKIISLIFRLILLTSLFSLLCFSLDRIDYLNTKLESVEYWNKTQDVYRIQVGVLNDNVLNDLATNKEYNDRINLFYNSIKENNDAFLINSDLFNVLEYKNKKPVYSYMMNITKPVDIYSPQGRSIIIDKNYLNVNPIVDKDNKLITDQIITSPNVLNLIVPYQYKKFEEEIVTNYLEWFFFQSTTVTNMYNKELKKPLSTLQKSDFNINVIYSKEQQKYFTFNSYTGDSKNNILDPIAIVYNDTLDTSNIGAYATSSLFYLDNSRGDAFNNIYGALKFSDVNEINSVVSIYDETNTQITSLKWEILQQVLGSIILTVFSLLLFMGYVWSYYYSQVYRLTINYLFGYSYLKNNKQIIIVSIILNVFATFISYLLFKNNIVLLFSISFLIAEMGVLYGLGRNLMKNNMQKVIKGEI